MLSQNWKELEANLSEPVVKVIRDDFKFSCMTPVQAACIPQFVSHKDVAVEAVTGSGKTIAFLVPIMEILLAKCENISSGRVYALIISPTRELTIQIHSELQRFLVELNQFSGQCFIGGTSMDSDTAKILAGNINILVATPGRFHDLLTRKETSKCLQSALKHLEVLVLDEADRLLALGFEKTISEIILHCPKQRRTGLFSATQTADVKTLIRAGLRNPVSIVVKEKHNSQRTPQNLHNYFMECNAVDKPSLLASLLQEQISLGNKVMVFFSTCAMVEYFSLVFSDIIGDQIVLSIHGKMRKKRAAIFKRFREQNGCVLLCTDVMARGIDVADVHLVVQYDPPSSAESFVHRCGRTARIGNEGQALILLLPNELEYVDFLKLNQRVRLEQKVSPQVACISDKFRQLQLEDRANMIAASRAFVSFVQSYAKHECRLIFQLKDLNLGGLAQGLGLLQLPKMPELRNRSTDDFIPADVDLNDVAFVSKSKEAARQAKLRDFKSTGVWPGLKPPKSKPWSEAKKKREGKSAKKKRRALSREQNMDKRKIADAEWDDIAEDARLLKKLKKGKLSKSKFDKSIGID